MKLNSWLIAFVATSLFETEHAKACDIEGAIRLENGQNKFEGRVEVCQGGEWRTVCDIWWGNEEAEVVCRQLGFSGNLDPVPETTINVFGRGSGGIIGARWRCEGTETDLLDCPRDSRSCNHDRDAGVYCFGVTPDNCVEGNIRLENGNGSSGRVEICLDGYWGTVCDDGWDSNDASTVCRQLGYNEIGKPIARVPTRRAHFGEGSGPIHLSRAQCSSQDTKLTVCTIDKTGINGCNHSEDAGVICMACEAERDIHLINGRNKFEGRVEVCQGGQWRTVCDEGWGNEEAEVVCRQLGFSGNLDPAPETHINVFGRGSGEIIGARWRCVGTETDLLDCPRGFRICNHDRDAGVYCFGETPDNCVEGNIRLEDSDGSSGRVEVCLDGYWGTVCDDGWDSNDANTVCRQLGYNEIGVPTREVYVGEKGRPIHLSRANCSSQDTRLTDCTIDKTGVNGCDHSEDAGVVCMACDIEGTIRLVNGRNKFEGRVEVCQGGQWRTVCDNWWGNEEARVVCRQLGFSGKLDPVPETDINVFGRGSGGIIGARWRCEGTETDLLGCLRDSRMCNHGSDAGVYCFGETPDNCVERNIRLENGNGSSGRVEICLDGYWGTVCDDGWDSNDANTVCRQLGYNYEKAIPTRGAYFGEGSGPIHLSRAECNNHDTNLTNCTIDKTGINSCDHSEDAGAICMGPNSCEDGDVQLVGGESEREGRVEICYSGVWGTVCADRGWDKVDANVVCRQLGHGQPAAISNTFGVGEGPTLLFNINCNHTHLELSQCVHPKSIGLGECNSQDERAGVICPELASFSTAIISQSVPSTMTMIEPSTTAALLSITSSFPHAESVFGSRYTSSTLTVFNNRSSTSSTDVYSTATVVFTTRQPSTDDTVLSNVPIREEKLQIILPAVGGVLVLAIITVICICFIGVMIARRKKSETKLGGSFDNPTYEGFDLTPLARKVNYERDQNPTYNDIGARPTTINANTDQVYKGLYSETTLVTEAVYECPNDSVPQDYLVPETILNKQQKDHGRAYLTGAGEGTTSETKDDDYSALGPTDYFTLQPHIPKPTQQQHPPANDEYSQLHHL